VSHRIYSSIVGFVACAAATTFSAPAFGEVITPFANGDFELGVPANDDPGPGFTLTPNSGFIGVNDEAASDLFDGNFVFLGSGAQLSVTTDNRLAVTAGVEYTLRADVVGFGDANVDDAFVALTFQDATGAEVNRSESGVSFEDGVLIVDLELQVGTAGDGAVTAGFDLFGNSGLSIDNFELVAVPEPSSAAAVFGLGLLFINRRRQK